MILSSSTELFLMRCIHIHRLLQNLQSCPQLLPTDCPLQDVSCQRAYPVQSLPQLQPQAILYSLIFSWSFPLFKKQYRIPRTTVCGQSYLKEIALHRRFTSQRLSRQFPAISTHRAIYAYALTLHSPAKADLFGHVMHYRFITRREEIVQSYLYLRTLCNLRKLDAE